MNLLRRAIAKSQGLAFDFLKLEEWFDRALINQGTILSEINKSKRSTHLTDYEFRVFSQRGEDGIIQFLCDAIGIKTPTFIEFGVEDFAEANCRFLMMKDNWSGFVIDGSERKIARLRNSYFYWQYEVNPVCAFITKDNINELLLRSGFGSDLGILSIDIDGNDYYVLEAINVVKPCILICEYNAVFGPTRKISIPYEADFDRARKHHSHLYFGASLSAITHAAEAKGYALVGTNSAASNAFYVRRDLLSDRVEVLSSAHAYTPSKARESRDARGNLSFVSGEERLGLIRGLPVLNVETNEIEPL